MEYSINRNEAFDSLEITFDGKPTEAVRNALKALKFRWHRAKGLWYGYATEDAARAAIEGAENATEATDATPAKITPVSFDKAAIRSEFAKAWSTPKMVDYCTNKVAAVATLPNGDIITVDKQSIETRFCFGESGYDLDDAAAMAAHARTSSEYFKRENMKHFTEWLHDLDDAADRDGRYKLIIYTGGTYTGQTDDCHLRTVDFARLNEIIDACGGSCHLDELPGKALTIRGRACRIATAEEIGIIRAAYETAAKAHEKKVNAYLKRYGTSKVHAWTYWRDA